MEQHPPLAQALGAQRLHEFLVQDLGNARPNGAGDDAHRNDRKRHDRQHHVLQMRGVQGEVARCHAHRRQHVELHGEDDDEDDAEPIMRHADAGYRDGRGQLVEPAAFGVTGDASQDRAEGEPHDRGAKSQDDGIENGALEGGRHRPPRRDRNAEIAGQDMAQPEHVLHRQRLVEAILLLEQLDRLGRGVRRHHGAERIARRDVDEQEDEHGDAERDGDYVKDPANDVCGHAVTSPPSKARRGPSGPERLDETELPAGAGYSSM